MKKAASLWKRFGMKNIWDEKNTCGFAYKEEEKNTDVRVSIEWSKHGGFDGVAASGGGLVSRR